ncbi:MAG: hypothetical protein AAF266_05415, partial [Planctomycetota bacterium]
MKRSEARARRYRRQGAHRRVGHRPGERRGVLLLVVLSMLVLFLLVGTTFLLTSGQYRTASKIVEQKNRTTFQPADLLERALMQLVRDTNNATSVARYHSLLRDLYGTDGFMARVYASANAINADPALPGLAPITIGAPRYSGATTTQPLGPTEGQLIDLLVLDAGNRSVLDPHDANAVGLDFNENGLPIDHILSTVDGYYDGCLLTFTTGPCRGDSVRVVSYEYLGSGTTPAVPSGLATGAYTGGVGRFRIMAPRRTDGRQLTVVSGLITDLIDGELGHRFIVNGRPFNGTGVGYDPLALSSDRLDAPTARLSAVEGVRFSPGQDDNYGFEIALTPNATHFDFARVTHLKRNRHSSPFSENLIYDPDNPTAPTNDYEYLNTLGDTALTPRDRPLYRNFAGPGDTDESYDAPDNQNMALASQALEPRARGRVVNAAGATLDPDAYYASSSAAPAYLDLEGVTIPSFHRPALVNFWFHRLFRNQWLTNLIGDPNSRVRAILEPYDANGAPRFGLNQQQAATLTAIKRKFLLRPLREDHPDFDGSNPLSRYASSRLRAALDGTALVNPQGAGDADDEITFPYWEAVGPWDVDNDGDGVNDSVWVDLGLPVQQTEDGRWYKPLVAMLVEDLDGRLNLNAHGSESDLVSDPLDASNDVDTAFLKANLAQDSTRLNSAFSDPTATTQLGWLRSSEQLPHGSGWGTAEVSLRSVLSPSLPLDQAVRGAGNFVGGPQYDDLARLLQGRPAPSVDGRTTAAPLNVSVSYGRYGSRLGLLDPAITAAKPGEVYLAQPGRTYIEALPAVRDVRTPLEFLGYPRFTGAISIPNREELNGFGSPLDLRDRYSTGLSVAGSAINEPAYESSFANLGTPDLTWRELAASAPDDSPYELDLSVAARKLPPVGVDVILRSYDADNNDAVDVNAAPLNDDAPFSAAELERVLRALDADSDELPDRLWQVVDAFDPTKLAAQNQVNNAIRSGGSPDAAQGNPNTLQNAVASARAAINRRLVTTDSFDLPVPNENWADRLALGADGRPGVPEFDTVGDWTVRPENRLPANDDSDFGIGEPGVDDDGDGTVDEYVPGADGDVTLTDEGDEVVLGYNASEVHSFATPSGIVTRTYAELFNAGCDDYVVIMRQDPPQPGRLIDFLKYRITLELARKGDIDLYPDPPLSPAQRVALRRQIDAATNSILFGRDLSAGDTTRVSDLHSFGGLLAPEVLAGRRMDLNRPFGDGRDNNGNGVVDEPQEAGEPWIDLNGDGVVDANEFVDLDGDGNFDGFIPGNAIQTVDHMWYDLDGDGVSDANELRPFDHVGGVDANGRGAFVTTDPTRRVYDDARMARQLFARHLYCLMLALVDENYLAPYDSDDPQVLHYLDPLSGIAGDADGRPVEDSSEAYRIAYDLRVANPGVSELLILNRARQIAQRKLTRRTIAQWAINVVDFRDPDSIQTPFEYDENPWDGWNVVDRFNDDAVYPIDGDLTTNENLAMSRTVGTGGISDPTLPSALPLQRLDHTRGVVWGAERPEVLLTEGVAWHDRRVEDEKTVADAAPSEQDEGNEHDGGLVAENGDDDLDQFRKPKGFAYVEAYNPHIDDDQRPAELYSHVDREGNFTLSPGVRLDRLSNEPAIPRGGPTIGAEDLIPTSQGTIAAGQVTRSPVWRIACVEEHPLIRNTTVDDTGLTPGGTTLVAGLTVDDPPTFAGNQTATPQSYLNHTLYGAPWLYGTDRSLGIDTLSFKGLEYEQMPEAYLDFHVRKKAEAEYALVTTIDIAFRTANSIDADGLLVPLGVIETPPTVPDTSFPSFDRFAQPFEPQSITLDLSSRVDAGPDGSIVRGINRKPTTYIERVFYMAAALPARVNESPSSASKIIVPAPGLIVPESAITLSNNGNAWFVPENSPGFHIPRLAYTVNGQTSDQTKANIYGPVVGFEAASDNEFIVHVSKFAAAYDRFNLDGDVHG